MALYLLRVHDTDHYFAGFEHDPDLSRWSQHKPELIPSDELGTTLLRLIAENPDYGDCLEVCEVRDSYRISADNVLAT